MARFAKIDELCGSEGGHALAAIGSATFLAERLVQIRSMFAGRDPDAGAGVLGVQCGRVGDLTYVANGVLMSGGVPVESLPGCGREIGVGALDEDGDVLGIKKVAVRAAIDAPEMVVVHFRSWSAVDGIFRGEDLAVDCSVFRFDKRRGVARLEFGGNV